MNESIQPEIEAAIKALSARLSTSPSLDETLNLINGIEELRDELLYTTPFSPTAAAGAQAGPAAAAGDGPKLAVIVGHTRSASGACGVSPIDSCEYFWNSAIANRMVELAPGMQIQCAVFYRDNGTAVAYRQADAWGAKAIIELHYNAATPSATGTETLWGKSLSIPWAERVQQRMLSQPAGPKRSRPSGPQPGRTRPLQPYSVQQSLRPGRALLWQQLWGRHDRPAA